MDTLKENPLFTIKGLSKNAILEKISAHKIPTKLKKRFESIEQIIGK